MSSTKDLNHKHLGHRADDDRRYSDRTALPVVIYIIRHGEKPAVGAASSPEMLPELVTPTLGIDSQGRPNEHSLTPRGWQRAGALAVAFAQAPPFDATTDLKPGALPPLVRPTCLFAAKYTDNANVTSTQHRAYQTLQPLSELLCEGDESGRVHPLGIDANFDVKDVEGATSAILKSGPGPVLVAWEHHAIYQASSSEGTGSNGLVGHLPVSNPADLPNAWPDDRFDLIWCFHLDSTSLNKKVGEGEIVHNVPSYTFSQRSQLLLANDIDIVQS